MSSSATYSIGDFTKFALPIIKNQITWMASNEVINYYNLVAYPGHTAANYECKLCGKDIASLLDDDADADLRFHLYRHEYKQESLFQ